MNHYKVRVYVGSLWSLFTQADHFEDHHFESALTLEEFAKRLMREGFRTGNKWIMPGAILSVELEK